MKGGAKLFDGSRFMNNVTDELLKTDVAKETFGKAGENMKNWEK